MSGYELQHGPLHLKQTLTAMAANSPGRMTDSGTATTPTSASYSGKRSGPTNHDRPRSDRKKADLVSDIKQPSSTNGPESQR